MSQDIEQLAARLRALITEWVQDAARAVFAQQSAALAAEQHERLALLAFGAGRCRPAPASSAPKQPDAAGVSWSRTICDR